jgi:hypothetical protein
MAQGVTGVRLVFAAVSVGSERARRVQVPN